VKEMTIRQTADALGLKVRTIRRWITIGCISAEKVGKQWQIPEEEVMGKEIQERANKGREHSKRIEEGIKLGVLARGGQDSKESIQRTECKEQ
jgi:excisionase family DNA binding protein